MRQLSSPEKMTPDSVLSAFELPLRRTFYPFGFPLQLETNSEEVLAAASEGWDAFHQTFDDAPVRLCLGVLPGSGEPLAPESVFRWRENLMSIVADAENLVVCDFSRGFAFGWVTQNTAADHPMLQYRFLTAAGATLVEQRAFAALHGGLVARNGKGVMLAGDSFAGKSTLAYACARSGWTYITDDCILVARRHRDRYAVGDPHKIRFRPDAPQLFPELADCLVTFRPNGKIAIEVLTRELDIETAPGCHVDHIVYLNRVPDSKVHLSPIAKERVRADWAQYNVLGTEDAREARQRCHERMLNAQLWEMSYSDLDEAVALLELLVDR